MNFPDFLFIAMPLVFFIGGTPLLLLALAEE
jgi:hypothetical protein